MDSPRDALTEQRRKAQGQTTNFDSLDSHSNETITSLLDGASSQMPIVAPEQVYFWISMSRLMERRMIESAIKFRIDDLFREAGIVIAFPQRDVHLDTQRPLELRIVDTEGGPESQED